MPSVKHPVAAMWKRFGVIVSVCALVAEFMLAPPKAEAGIESIHSGSHIAVSLYQMPYGISGEQFSLLMWVWVEPDVGSRSLVGVPGVWELSLDEQSRPTLAHWFRHQGGSAPPRDIPPGERVFASGTGVRGGGRGASNQSPADDTGLQSGGAPWKADEDLLVRTEQAIPVRTWTLVWMRIDRPAGKYSVRFCAADGTEGAASTEYVPTRRWIFSGSQFVIGAQPTKACVRGLFGLVMIRSDACSQQDLRQIVESRRYFAALDLNSVGYGGQMIGEPGMLWMTNHGAAPNPSVTWREPGYSQAGYSGAPVTLGNVVIRDGKYPDENFVMVRQVKSASGFVYRSHHEEPFAGHFEKDIPGTGIGPGFRSAPQTVARELVTGATALRRIIISANSRAVKYSDGSGISPGNFPHGFIENLRSQVAGVLMRPTQIYRTNDPWFGFDLKDNEPVQSYSKVTNTALTTGNVGDFSRFFTGSAFIGRGPGWGVFVEPSGYYGLRCKPEPGSLMVAEAPLVVEAYALRFPGASPLRWRAERGQNQLAPGISSEYQSLDGMDTTRAVHVMTQFDSAGPDLLRINGDYRGQVVSGDAAVVVSGTGRGCISIVDTVDFDGVQTVIRLRKPLHEAPSTGSHVHFGTWSFVTVQTRFEALQADDPANWRGIRFDTSAGGLGAVVFAYSAYRPDVEGFAFGGAGWGGHGYTLQLDRSFREANTEWMKLTGADVWIQVPAQQGSQPSSMDDYLALIRQALPQCDVIWAGESGLEASLQTAWHQYILANAESRGVIGLSILEEPSIGTIREQYADLMLGDGDHYSQRGNEVVARAWLSGLSRAVRRQCIADVNLDEAVDFEDFLLFFGAYDAADPLADLNGDARIDFGDFLEFMGGYDVGCGS